MLPGRGIVPGNDTLYNSPLRPGQLRTEDEDRRPALPAAQADSLGVPKQGTIHAEPRPARVAFDDDPSDPILFRNEIDGHGASLQGVILTGYLSGE
jgi:hypothetical protein